MEHIDQKEALTKSLHSYLWLFMLLLASLVGIAGMVARPALASTAVAQSTTTPAPSSTPEPEVTATAPITATERITTTLPLTTTTGGTVTGTVPITATSTPEPLTSVVAVETFEGQCPLRTVDDAEHAFGCENGEYAMLAKKGGYIWRAPYGDTYDDGVISVEVRAPTGDTGVEYGIVLRASTDGQYYLFALSPYGEYGFYRYSPATKWTTLIEPTASAAIRKGPEKNQLQVIMQGSQFALYANDQFLDTVTDSMLARGLLAFALMSENDNGKAVFDNIVVSKINRPLTLPAGKDKPAPPDDIPAGMGALVVYNWSGNEMNYTIAGKLYKVPANGNTIIVLAPGMYTFSFDAPGIKANCSTAQGCKVTIEAGKYVTQSWAMQR